MFPRSGLGIVFCIASLASLTDCYRILAICPRASASHQIVFRGLTLALNSRGHELVVVTTDPINDKTLQNYTEIDISVIYNSNEFVLNSADWVTLFPRLKTMLDTQTVEILENPEFRKLYAPKNEQTFDLILLEMMYWPALLPLAERFEAPTIGFSPLGLTLNIQYSFGNPIIPSHPSNWDVYTITGPFTFYQRVENFIKAWRFLHYYNTVYVPSQEAIARRYFGDEISPLLELEKNVSLVFVNQPAPISYVKPNVPKIIGVSGFHMSQEIEPLSKDIEKFLDDAAEGFVYMSLGSNMKSSLLSNATLNEFVAAFSSLPYKVLWKFEDDVLPNKPDNVHIAKWVSQRAVLAHPNLKAFVYQGGLQSTEEAVSAAVPLIGLPTWADQKMQVDKMVSVGVAKRLEISKVDRTSLQRAILEVTRKKSYKENMIHLRALMKENSNDFLENAIWWTEHVMRNKGARYLHSSTADEPWYRRQDMDIVAFMSAVITTVLCLLLSISYRLLALGVKLFNGRLGNQKQKVL